jgi:hypothetical protein
MVMLALAAEMDVSARRALGHRLREIDGYLGRALDRCGSRSSGGWGYELSVGGPVCVVSRGGVVAARRDRLSCHYVGMALLHRASG